MCKIQATSWKGSTLRRQHQIAISHHLQQYRAHKQQVTKERGDGRRGGTSGGAEDEQGLEQDQERGETPHHPVATLAQPMQRWPMQGVATTHHQPEAEEERRGVLPPGGKLRREGYSLDSYIDEPGL